MRFYENNQQLEYNIIIEPGANLSRIQFALPLKSLSHTKLHSQYVVYT